MQYRWEVVPRQSFDLKGENVKIAVHRWRQEWAISRVKSLFMPVKATDIQGTTEIDGEWTVHKLMVEGSHISTFRWRPGWGAVDVEITNRIPIAEDAPAPPGVNSSWQPSDSTSLMGKAVYVALLSSILAFSNIIPDKSVKMGAAMALGVAVIVFLAALAALAFVKSKDKK